MVLIIGEYQEYPDEDQATYKNRTQEKEASAHCFVVILKRRTQLQYVVLFFLIFKSFNFYQYFSTYM
ncbi:hypothetical protein Hanom_Chr11g01032021 [Helianthus anomalus]